MALNLKNETAERLAKEVSALTGESLTQAVIRALDERLARLRGRRTASSTYEAIMEISRRASALPDLDTRSDEEILGYDDTGGFR